MTILDRGGILFAFRVLVLRCGAVIAFCMAVSGCDGEAASEGAVVYIDNVSDTWTVSGVFIVKHGSVPGWGLNLLTSSIGPSKSGSVHFDPDTVDIRITADHPESPLEFFALPASVGTSVQVYVSTQSMDAYW